MKALRLAVYVRGELEYAYLTPAGYRLADGTILPWLVWWR